MPACSSLRWFSSLCCCYVPDERPSPVRTATINRLLFTHPRYLVDLFAEIRSNGRVDFYLMNNALPSSRSMRLSRWAVVCALLLTPLVYAEFASSAHAAGTLVTYFNFNDGNLTYDPPGSRPSQITPNNVTTSFVTPGSTLNIAPGDPVTGTTGNSALRLTRTGTDPQYIQFSFSTLGLVDISLSYATRSGSNGFTSEQLFYSTDGTNFTSFGSVTVAQNNTFSVKSFDLSAINGIENQANVTFRIVLTGGNGTGSNSFTDFDNIQVNSVPEPATFGIAGLALLGLCWQQRGRLAATRDLFRFRRAPL